MPKRKVKGRAIVLCPQDVEDDAWLDGLNGRCKEQVNLKRWTMSAVLAAAALAAMPKVLPALALQPVETREEVALKDIQQQEAILSDAGATPAQRDDAARRLVSRSSKEADDVLLKVLKEFGNRDGQLAVARALASDPTPEPMFIDPLTTLLGSGVGLTEAAAQALVTYKGNEGVRETLTNFANNPTYVLEGRLGVIAAMGKLVDKRAAGALVEMVNASDTNARIRDAASDALAEMTGLPRGQDVQAWIQWWMQNRDKSEEEWSKDLLRGMAARRAELDKRLRKVLDETDRRLRESYRAAANDADKTKLLGEFLKNDSEDMRLLGVNLIGEESAQFRAVPPAVFEQLRKMVGDSASQVRLSVAVTLGNAGERGAVDALLTQLAQENDLRVKAEIVRALGPSHDLRVVDPLLKALNSPNFKVAGNAADALADLSVELRKPENSELATAVAAELNIQIDKLRPDASNRDFRRGLVYTMAALGHPSSRERLQKLAGNNELDERVRQLSLRGLGLIGSPASVLFITPALDDPSKQVQVEACRALKTCADEFGIANVLKQRIGNNVPEEVREAAWDALSALFKKASDQELRTWNQYLQGDIPARRLRVQEELELRYIAQKSDEKLALIRQDIGAQYLAMNQPEKAAEKTQQALEYLEGHNALESVIEPVITQLLEAKIKTKKYSTAVDFALDRLPRQPSIGGILWRRTLDQYKQLIAAQDWAGAQELLTQFKRLELKTYAPVVQQMEDDLKKLQTTGGRVYVRQGKAYEHVARFQFHMV